MPAYRWTPALGASFGKPTGICTPDPLPSSDLVRFRELSAKPWAVRQLTPTIESKFIVVHYGPLWPTGQRGAL
jgi:hypothetical protein